MAGAEVLLENIRGYEKMQDNSFLFFRGRTAFYAILEALGIKSQDEIIVPGFTCMAVPNAIKYLGARPVYVDIDSKTFNIDPEKIEEKITQKTKAIIVQHTFGIPAEMDKIITITKERNIYLIEDSCHTLASKYKGNQVGTFGEAAFYSSQWSKPITTGLGGWAIVNSEDVRQKLSKVYERFTEPSKIDVFCLRFQFGLYSLLFKPPTFYFFQKWYRLISKLDIVPTSFSCSELECKMPKKYKQRGSQWQKSILKEKIAAIDSINAHRRHITSIYSKFLKGSGIPVLPDYYDVVFLSYPVLVKDKMKTLKEARGQRLELGDWFISPVHPVSKGLEKFEYYKGVCPVAENICEHIINLPTHTLISEAYAYKIVNFLKDKI